MFEKLEQDALIRFYGEQARSVDDLPYTVELEEILDKMDREFGGFVKGRRDVYLELMRLRKAGRLPRRTGAATRDDRQERLF